MRDWMLAVAACLLLAVSPAAAAPTCVNRQGDPVRCATKTAMPVGWTPSPQILWERQLAAAPGPGTREILKVVFGIALFLALIALLPDFGGGWDRQESDKQSDRSGDDAD